MQSTWSCHSAVHEIQETMRHSRANQACPSWNSSFSIFMGGMHCGCCLLSLSGLCHSFLQMLVLSLANGFHQPLLSLKGRKERANYLSLSHDLTADPIKTRTTVTCRRSFFIMKDRCVRDVWKNNCIWQIFVGSTRWPWCIHVCEQNHWNEAKIPVPTQCACHTSLDEDFLRESSR